MLSQQIKDMDNNSEFHSLLTGVNKKHLQCCKSPGFQELCYLWTEDDKKTKVCLVAAGKGNGQEGGEGRDYDTMT